MFKQIDLKLWRDGYAAGYDYYTQDMGEIARTLNLISEGFDGNPLQTGVCFALLWVLKNPEAIKVMDQMKSDIEAILELEEKNKVAEKPKS